MKKLQSLILAAGVMALCSCDPNSLMGGGDNGGNGGNEDLEALTIGGAMNENATLKDRGLSIDYTIDGTLNLEGNAVLTIEPGVCIAFLNSGSSIVVGENCGINWVGTEKDPIVFRGPKNNNNPGSWKWIDIYSKRRDNCMEYVEIKNGGSDRTWAPVILEDNAKLAMKHCTIDGSLGNGIVACSGSAFTAFEYNTIKNAEKYAVQKNIYGMSETNFGEGNTYTGNKPNAICLYGTYSGEGDMNLTYQGVPYVSEDGLNIEDNCNLTIAPGVTLMVNDQIDINEKATISAKGTEEAPIIFCGLYDEPGAWGFIDLFSTKGAEFENVIIANSCKDNYGGAIWFNSRDVHCTMTNVVIRNSGNYGLYFSDVELREVDNVGEEGTHYECVKPEYFNATNVTFENCKKGNVSVGGDLTFDEFPW